MQGVNLGDKIERGKWARRVQRAMGIQRKKETQIFVGGEKNCARINERFQKSSCGGR